ncbi:hypothetical protein TcWFU_003794 [Taenia crassiceps]|uniref:Uncharacterized protein n=1 Tax=Taenia crassiceps TaxID=6207 RepID=A0ABR4Q7T9_9CEST
MILSVGGCVKYLGHFLNSLLSSLAPLLWCGDEFKGSAQALHDSHSRVLMRRIINFFKYQLNHQIYSFNHSSAKLFSHLSPYLFIDEAVGVDKGKKLWYLHSTQFFILRHEARIACEIAYCLEICTMKALTLQDIPEDWSLPSILQVVVGLSACLFPDAQNTTWTGQDGYRCEHALQTLANLVELASKSSDFLDSYYSLVLNIFHTCLHTTNISGAEKIRWNTALASCRLLQTISNGDQLVEALCEAFNTDPYFKVRAYAGLSLLLQLLRGPGTQQTSSIIGCSLRFLSTDLRYYFTKPVAADALQYQVICPYIAGRLLLQVGILSLQGLQQNWEEGLLNLNRIAEELERNEALKENLKNSWQYAKDAKVAATAVVKGNAGGVTRGGLARMPKQPMVISFAERYSLLRTLKLDQATDELSRTVKTFVEEVRVASNASLLTPKLAQGLTRLIHAMTIEEAVETLQRTHLSTSHDQLDALPLVAHDGVVD